MKAISYWPGGCWAWLLAGLVLGNVSFAQTADINTAPGGSPVALASPTPAEAWGTSDIISSTLSAFVQEQRALAQGWQTLVSQGATPEQLQAWRQQNATQFAMQQERAEILAAASALGPMPIMEKINIPSNASAALANFLITRANLANARAQIHNQLLQALPASVTQEQVSQMLRQEARLFQQQQADNVQVEAQQAQALAAESGTQPLPVPGPAVIPPNATPQLQAYLTARNALAQDRTQVWNQNVAAGAAAARAAMQEWERQNATRLKQLSQLAQDLSNSASNQEGNNQ